MAVIYQTLLIVTTPHQNLNRNNGNLIKQDLLIQYSKECSKSQNAPGYSMSKHSSGNTKGLR